MVIAHRRDSILLECGHSGLCVECATVLWDRARRCPLCRQSFAAVMRIVAREAAAVPAASPPTHTNTPYPPLRPFSPAHAGLSRMCSRDPPLRR